MPFQSFPSFSPNFLPFLYLTLIIILNILTKPIQAIPTPSNQAITFPNTNIDTETETNTTTNSTSSPPVQIRCITELGNITSLNTNVVRDLGFAGQIGPYTLLSYGDTLYRRPNTVNDLQCDEFLGMTSNSVAFATHDPTKVLDPLLDPKNNNWPTQFVPVNKSWGEDMATHAVGITNAIETDGAAGEGILYTLLNHRPGGVQHIQGAGIATIKLDFSTSPPTPVARRTAPFLWNGDEHPWYGDVSALRTATHIYAYGHKKDSPYVYLARCPVNTPLDLSSYEYFHGNATWSTTPLTGPGIDETQSVFWQVNQGAVLFSPYLAKFLFVYCDNFWSSTLLLKYADVPEGPWSESLDLVRIEPVTRGGTIYAAAPQGQYDVTGRTLVVGFTNHPNVLQGVRVEFV